MHSCMPPSARSERNRRSSGTVETRGAPVRPHQGNSSTQPAGTPPPTCVPQCAANETCQSGSCVCAPDCTGKDCGDDGCGGSCGDCTGSETWTAVPAYVSPSATARPAALTGAGSCGTCGAQEVCDGGSCLCTPECGTKVCGGDGCGGSCGSCRDQGVATRSRRVRAVAAPASATRLGPNAWRRSAPATRPYDRPAPATGRAGAPARPSSRARTTSFAVMGPA